MAILSLYLVLCLSAAAFGFNKEPEKNYLNDGRVQVKLTRMGDGAKKIAVLVKNIVFKSPGDEARFTDIANDVSFGAPLAIHELNQAIPFIKNKQLRESLIKLVDAFTNAVHENQHNLHGSTETLRECLSTALDKTNDATQALSKILHENDCQTEIFLSHQLRKALNIGTFYVLKVKYQSELFHKTNKELESEIEAGLESFCKFLQNYNNDQHAIENLIYVIEDFKQILEEAIYNLKDYLFLNKEDKKNFAIAKEVLNGLKTASNTLPQSCDDHEFAHIKTEFEKVYKSAINFIKKLVNVEVVENTPSQLLIRSVLIDPITSSYAFERELSSSNVVPKTR